jgi:hypothetical protein
MNRIDNYNYDDTFLSLLSSQRELLKQIRTEGINYQQNLRDKLTTAHGSNQDQPSISERPQGIKHFCEDQKRSREDSFVPTDHHHQHDFSSFPTKEPLLTFDTLNELHCDPMTRRPPLQNVRYLDTEYNGGCFNDFTANCSQRRPSIQEHSLNCVDHELMRIQNCSPININAHSMEDTEGCQIYDSDPKSLRKCDFLGKGDLGPKIQPQNSLDYNYKGLLSFEKRDEVDKKAKSLANALEESYKSQQAIHKWDRKMGLKRSHSKTMSMSMQSRKKLKLILLELPVGHDNMIR